MSQVAAAIRPWVARQKYSTWKSKFGPAYKSQPNFAGITAGKAAQWAPTAAYMGGAAGIFVFFMFAEIPRVSRDIAEKIPIIGPWFHKEIPPEDNPF